MAKILAVDDDPTCLTVLKLQLEKLGHEVIAVENGELAIEKLATDGVEGEKEFDLIITDEVMTEISGQKLLSELLRLEYTMPVILAGGSTKNRETELKALGFAVVLTKPIPITELQKAVDAALASKD